MTPVKTIETFRHDKHERKREQKFVFKHFCPKSKMFRSLIDLDKTSTYCIKIPKLVLKCSLLYAGILLYTHFGLKVASIYSPLFFSGETSLPSRKLIIIISINGISIPQTFLD